MALDRGAEREYRYKAKGMTWPHWKTLDKHREEIPDGGRAEPKETPECKEGYKPVVNPDAR